MLSLGVCNSERMHIRMEYAADLFTLLPSYKKKKKKKKKDFTYILKYKKWWYENILHLFFFLIFRNFYNFFVLLKITNLKYGKILLFMS